MIFSAGIHFRTCPSFQSIEHGLDILRMRSAGSENEILLQRFHPPGGTTNLLLLSNAPSPKSEEPLMK